MSWFNSQTDGVDNRGSLPKQRCLLCLEQRRRRKGYLLHIRVSSASCAQRHERGKRRRRTNATKLLVAADRPTVESVCRFLATTELYNSRDAGYTD